MSGRLLVSDGFLPGIPRLYHSSGSVTANTGNITWECESSSAPVDVVVNALVTDALQYSPPFTEFRMTDTGEDLTVRLRRETGESTIDISVSRRLPFPAQSRGPVTSGTRSFIFTSLLVHRR